MMITSADCEFERDIAEIERDNTEWRISSTLDVSQLAPYKRESFMCCYKVAVVVAISIGASTINPDKVHTHSTVN